MEGTWSFGLAVLVVALAGVAAVVSNRLSERTRVPAPAFFLVAAAVAVDLAPALRKLSTATVQDIVTIALVVLLFQGGMEIGWRRFRPEARAILTIGVVGTFATAGLIAVAAHVLLGLSWLPTLLLGTALSPTDPAVVFSVLGRRKITGRTGVLLPGESGANDPVGIALMAGLLGASAGSALDTAGHTALLFGQEMVIGMVLGAGGGWALKVFMRKVPLPAEGLYPLRTLASVFALYGLTTVAHGSGFLAVFVAGVLLGDVRAPYKKEIERFHTALGSLGEIVAFAALGLTVPLWTFTAEGAWTDGLLLAVLLAFVVRPIVMVPLLWRMRLRRGERIFLGFAGLKGAVPILLGSYIVSAGVTDADRLYDIVFVVVFSVIVQGSLLPTVARLCRVPIRSVELEPWTLGVRLRERPEGVTRHSVEAGAAADGRTVGELDLGEETWISLVVREGQLVPVTGSTRLRAGDEVLLLTGDDEKRCAGLFSAR